MYKHRINADREYFGYPMRTRKHYHDDHILRSFFAEKEKDYYRIPKNPKTVIDIGANIGCVSILCAEKGAKVFAYEPASDNFETLEHNIKLNGYSNNIKCIKKAVGKRGQSKLYIHPKNSGATSLFLHQNGAVADKYEMVEVISIHDVFEQNNIEHCDLLKLDAEGAEKDIIYDLDDKLVKKIAQISLEFHGRNRERCELNDILSKWYNGENIRRFEWVYTKKYEK